MRVARSNDWKLPRNRRIAIADRLATMAKSAEPTAFAIEGPARHGIRASLCLQGWPWGASDAEATVLTLRSLQIVGAKRPRWDEGQPEYCQPGVLPIERHSCVHCGKPLPEGHYKFCSSLCLKAHRLVIAERQNREEINAQAAASRAAWTERQPPRVCPGCGRNFQPKRADAKFCSRECSHESQRHTRRALRVVCEAL
jgi:hypothetical protein